MSSSSQIEKYLRARVGRDDYRGIHIAQHNRLPEDKLVAILDAMRVAVGEDEFDIPPGDEPNPGRKHNPRARRQVAGFDDYYSILDNIAKSSVKGVSATFNSLKKNHFPNFESMGLLDRRDSGRIGHLTRAAVMILDAGKTRKRTILIGQAMEKLVGTKFANELHELLRDLSQLNVWEVMLVVSDPSLGTDQKTQLVRSYRRLRAVDRLELHETIRSICEPTMLLSKKDRRDWHNWWNEAKQIVTMLAFVPGFMVLQEEHLMLAGAAGIPLFERARSAQIKREAMDWHQLAPKTGWELHHIYPVEYATSAADMALIDAKQNLIYIPKGRHQQIPRQNNRSVGLRFDATNVYLVNPANLKGLPKFDFVIPKEVAVKIENLPAMVAYNEKLLKSVG
jgi:hypothetical protein